MRKVYKVLPYILSASLALGGAAFLPLPMSPAAVVQAEETGTEGEEELKDLELVYDGEGEYRVEKGETFYLNDIRYDVDFPDDWDGDLIWTDVECDLTAFEKDIDEDDGTLYGIIVNEPAEAVKVRAYYKTEGAELYKDSEGSFEVTLNVYEDNRGTLEVSYNGPKEITVTKGDKILYSDLEKYFVIPSDYDGTFRVTPIMSDEAEYDLVYDEDDISIGIIPSETGTYDVWYDAYDSELYKDESSFVSVKFIVVEAKAPSKKDKKAETPAAITAKKVAVSGPSKNIAAGKKVQLKAVVTPKNVTKKGVTWTSSNKKYATVNSKGLVTTKKAGKGKKVTIIAKSKDGKAAAKYVINIKKAAVKSVKLSGKASVKAGKSLKLKAKVKAGKGAFKKLAWTTSNKKFATVNAKGVVKTKKAGKGKTVTITAKALDGSGKKATKKIKIK